MLAAPRADENPRVLVLVDADVRSTPGEACLGPFGEANRSGDPCWNPLALLAAADGAVPTRDGLLRRGGEGRVGGLRSGLPARLGRPTTLPMSRCDPRSPERPATPPGVPPSPGPRALRCGWYPLGGGISGRASLRCISRLLRQRGAASPRAATAAASSCCPAPEVFRFAHTLDEGQPHARRGPGSLRSSAAKGARHADSRLACGTSSQTAGREERPPIEQRPFFATGQYAGSQHNGLSLVLRQLPHPPCARQRDVCDAPLLRARAGAEVRVFGERRQGAGRQTPVTITQSFGQPQSGPPARLPQLARGRLPSGISLAQS